MSNRNNQKLTLFRDKCASSCRSCINQHKWSCAPDIENKRPSHQPKITGMASDVVTVDGKNP